MTRSTADARDLLVRLLLEVAPDIEPADIRDDEPLQQSLDLDSMDFLHLVAAVEEATAVTIAEHDYPQLQTLAAASAYLAGRWTDEG